MMTTKEFFHNKINWKIYNRILDICTELDDNSIDYNISVQVCQRTRKINDRLSDRRFHTIYQYDDYPVHDDYEAYAFEDYYKQMGLFYTIEFYETYDWHSIIDKISKSKDIILIDDLWGDFRLFRYKEKKIK